MAFPKRNAKRIYRKDGGPETQYRAQVHCRCERFVDALASSTRSTYADELESQGAGGVFPSSTAGGEVPTRLVLDRYWVEYVTPQFECKGIERIQVQCREHYNDC